MLRLPPTTRREYADEPVNETSLDQVARLMAEHECIHLVVVSSEDGRPTGVVSSIDVASAMARSGELVRV